MKVEQPMRWKENSEDHEIFLSFPIRKKKNREGTISFSNVEVIGDIDHSTFTGRT